MSKYRIYAKQMDDLARNRFADFEMEKAKFERAKRDLENCPIRLRVDPIRDGDYVLKRKKLEVAVGEAERKFREAEEAFKGTLTEVKQIRSELYQKLKEDLAVDPEDLDKNTVDLLRSGICSAAEVSKLFEDAETITTKRYVASFAKSQVTERTDPQDREILNNVANAGERLSNPDFTDTMQRFDEISDVLIRCIRNPNMLGHWATLTENIIAEM